MGSARLKLQARKMTRLDPTFPSEFLRDVRQLMTDARLPSRFRGRDCRHAVASIKLLALPRITSLEPALSARALRGDVPDLQKLAGLRVWFQETFYL